MSEATSGQTFRLIVAGRRKLSELVREGAVQALYGCDKDRKHLGSTLEGKLYGSALGLAWIAQMGMEDAERMAQRDLYTQRIAVDLHEVLGYDLRYKTVLAPHERAPQQISSVFTVSEYAAHLAVYDVCDIEDVIAKLEHLGL